MYVLFILPLKILLISPMSRWFSFMVKRKNTEDTNHINMNAAPSVSEPDFFSRMKNKGQRKTRTNVRQKNSLHSGAH